MNEIGRLEIDGRKLDSEEIKVRKAARAVIFLDDRLLMIRSNRYGDYKFPGGGVEKEENLTVALVREVREEAGCDIVGNVVELGFFRELRPTLENPNVVFENRSYYFLTSIGKKRHRPCFDDYEKEHDYACVSVDLHEALETNKRLIGTKSIPWVRREVIVLEYLINHREEIKQKGF